MVVGNSRLRNCRRNDCPNDLVKEEKEKGYM
jgi:hypothetical protein